MFRATGRLKEARAAYTDAATINRQLAADYPNQPELRQGAADTLGNLANVCNECGDFRAARGFLEESLAHHRAAVKANPRHPGYRRFNLNHLLVSVSTHAGLDDRSGALRAAEGIRDLGGDPPSDAPVTVNFATADGTAAAGEDYVAASGTLTFAPGETTKTITVVVKGDKQKEADETFSVNLFGAFGALILDGQGLGSILDDRR